MPRRERCPSARIAGVAALAAVAAAGCAAGEVATADAGEVPPPDPVCAAPFHPAASGLGCEAVLPPADCPPGTMPVLGDPTCRPVGWTSCPPGFEADPIGWGCREVLPASRCAGATVEIIGQRSCQALGDCAAPFPPPGATHFVDDSYAPSQLDATHFNSVFAAVQAAPAGSVVAVEAGTYVENVDVVVPLKLVGRCAAQVILSGPGDNRAGVLVAGARGVEVRGVTLSGHVSGVYVHNQGEALVADALLSRNRWMGLYVLGPGSSARLLRARVEGTLPDSQGRYGWGVAVQGGGSLEVTHSAIVGNHSSGLVVSNAGSTAKVASSLVRDTVSQTTGTSPGRFGTGISVAGGGQLALASSALVGNRSANLAVQNAGSRATVTGTVFRGALPDGFGEYGRSIQVTSGGRAEVDSSALVDSAESGLVLVGTDSSALLAGSVVRGPIPAVAAAFGEGIVVTPGTRLDVAQSALVVNRAVGLVIQDGGSANVSDSLVRDTKPSLSSTSGMGMGIQVGFGGRLALTGSALVANRSASLLVTRKGATGTPSSATVSSTVIRDTFPDKTGAFGHGIEVNLGGQLELRRSAVVGNRQVGLSVSLPTSSASVWDSVIGGTAARPDGSFGYGLLAYEDARVRVTGCQVRDNPGIGLAFAQGSGGVAGTVVTGNAVGIHVQDGSTLKVADAVPDAIAPGDVYVTSDARLEGNVTRFGAGQVPLPDPFPD